MKIQIFHLTQMSSFQYSRNLIDIVLNNQTIVSQPIAHMKYADRYRLSRMLNLNLIDLIKFVTNYYTKYNTYIHYELLWSSEDICEIIPFLEIICKNSFRQYQNYESIINLLADQL